MHGITEEQARVILDADRDVSVAEAQRVWEESARRQSALQHHLSTNPAFARQVVDAEIDAFLSGAKKAEALPPPCPSMADQYPILDSSVLPKAREEAGLPPLHDFTSVRCVDADARALMQDHARLLGAIGVWKLATILSFALGVLAGAIIFALS